MSGKNSFYKTVGETNVAVNKKDKGRFVSCGSLSLSG